MSDRSLLPVSLSLSLSQHLYHASPAPSSASSLSSASSSCAASSPPILLSMSSVSGAADAGVGGHNGYDGHHESHHVYGAMYHPGSSSGMLHQGQQHQQYTTLNSAASLSSNGMLTSGHHSSQQQQQAQQAQQQQQQLLSSQAMSLTSTAITPTSVSSFFNSFGTGSGNSPPPLTPNGLLSGLHSFLFADSSTLGLDSFVDGLGPVGGISDVSCLLPPPVSSVNSYLVPAQGQMQAGQPLSSPSSGTLGASGPGGGGQATNQQIRLPPFCTI